MYVVTNPGAFLPLHNKFVSIVSKMLLRDCKNAVLSVDTVSSISIPERCPTTSPNSRPNFPKLFPMRVKKLIKLPSFLFTQINSEIKR